METFLIIIVIGFILSGIFYLTKPHVSDEELWTASIVKEIEATYFIARHMGWIYDLVYGLILVMYFINSSKVVETFQENSLLLLFLFGGILLRAYGIGFKKGIRFDKE